MRSFLTVQHIQNRFHHILVPIGISFTDYLMVARINEFDEFGRFFFIIIFDSRLIDAISSRRHPIDMSKKQKTEKLWLKCLDWKPKAKNNFEISANTKYFR